MKIIFLILAAIVFYLLIEVGVFWYKASNLPDLTKIDQSSLTLGEGPILRYIAAGDSTAVGVGASSREKGYAYKVAKYFSKDYTVQYKNIGVIGYKTDDVLEKQISEIIVYKPDVVTISMGANDGTHLVNSNKVLVNYKAIIAKLEAETSAKIYITDVADLANAKVLPWFYRKIIEHRSAKINPKISYLENDRVKIVNIHDFGWKNYPDIQTTFSADNFHPNDLGYENWTNAFLDKISTN